MPSDELGPHKADGQIINWTSIPSELSISQKYVGFTYQESFLKMNTVGEVGNPSMPFLIEESLGNT